MPEDVVKPSQCIFAIGLPTSRAAFERDRRSELKDFVPKRLPSWLRYTHEIILPFRHYLPHYRKLGVQVVEEVDETTLRSLFSENSHAVLILFSHFTDQHVELSDRMVSVTRFVELVPEGFDGIIDLCVCHPDGLPFRLRDERPASSIKFTHREATTAAWLAMYRVMFELLKRCEMSYAKGLEGAIVRLTA